LNQHFLGKAVPQDPQAKVFPEPRIPFAPLHYICHRTPAPLSIDGELDEPAWQKAARTEDFVDIDGALKPKPRFRTRAKILWDADYLYFARRWRSQRSGRREPL